LRSALACGLSLLSFLSAVGTLLFQRPRSGAGGGGGGGGGGWLNEDEEAGAQGGGHTDDTPHDYRCYLQRRDVYR